MIDLISVSPQTTLASSRPTRPSDRTTVMSGYRPRSLRRGQRIIECVLGDTRVATCRPPQFVLLEQRRGLPRNERQATARSSPFSCWLSASRLRNIATLGFPTLTHQVAPTGTVWRRRR